MSLGIALDFVGSHKYKLSLAVPIEYGVMGNPGKRLHHLPGRLMVREDRDRIIQPQPSDVLPLLTDEPQSPALTPAGLAESSPVQAPASLKGSKPALLFPNDMLIAKSHCRSNATVTRSRSR